MSDSVIPKNALDKLARRYGLGQYAGTITTRPPVNSGATALTSQRILDDGQGFVFEHLQLAPHQYQTVRLNYALLDGGSNKTQTQWWDHSKSSTDAVLPNGIVIYQMMRRLYSLRDDPGMQDTITAVRELMKADWSNPWRHSGTRINYQPGSVDAVVEQLQLDGTITSQSLPIPAYEKFDDNWSYLIMAQEQPESALCTTASLPATALPVLEALLGPHADEAAPVFQYLSTRKGTNLREVRLWTPMLANRNDVRALVLGVYGVDIRFYVSADISISNDWPARGVAVRENFQGK